MATIKEQIDFLVSRKMKKYLKKAYNKYLRRNNLDKKRYKGYTA
jgi:hypothetical protein